MRSEEIELPVDVYEKPRLEVIDLAGEDVFTTGCKGIANSGVVIGDCITSSCLGY